VLLYVGITHSLRVRFAQHAKEKSWWPEVAKRTAEWYGSEREARRAETAAIRDEMPLHNIKRPRPLRLPCVRRGPTRAATFRCPRDVLAAVRLRAEDEGYTLTDVLVSLLRAYGDCDPEALAIVAGVPVEVFQSELSLVP
jgi:predicted GIY-YIG superfamily endonuclease